MRGVTADTQTWLAARQFLLQRANDFHLQLTLARESFEPEAIHDLRVSSRRLREGIAIFSACFRKRQLAPVRQELKNLTGMLGFIRNCDEALLFFLPLTDTGEPDARTTVGNIVATLQKQRENEQRRLKRELKKIDPDSLLQRIDAICDNPRIFNPSAELLFQPVASFILEAIALREKNMLELLPAALLEENASAQHRLRIAVKRFRYRMEFLSPIARGNYKRVYSVIKEYQEILGRMHDLDVFRELLADPADEPGKSFALHNMIIDRRSLFFNEFLRLHKEHPLDKMAELVRGLL